MSPATPRVSVIAPVYNGDPEVIEACRSVLGQSIGDLELLVIDDGSTDATPALLADLASADDRVRVIRQENQGLTASRNHGLAEARADIVGFIDHDDLWRLDKLELQLPRLRPGVAVYSDAEYVDLATGDSFGRFDTYDRFPSDRAKFSGDILPAILAQDFISAPSLLIRREDALAAGGFGNPYGEAVEAWSFWIRCARRFSFDRVDEPLVVVRRRPGSLNQRHSYVRETSRKMLLGVADELDTDGDLTPELRGAIGLGLFSSRNMGPAARMLLGAALRQPWRLRWWKWLAACALWKPLRGHRSAPGAFAEVQA